MKDKIKKILFISPVNQNFFRYREHELPLNLLKRGYQCIYLNPVKHKKNTSPRLFETVDNNWPSDAIIVNRKSKIRKSLLALITESIDNVKKIKQYRPDVVIASDHLMSLLACRYCNKKNIRFIFDVTDDWGKVDSNFFTRSYWKFIVKPFLKRKASVIVSTSYKQAEYLKGRQKPTLIIPNGKSIEFINEVQKHIIPTNQKIVNFIGNLREGYDYDLLFSVFEQIPEYKLNMYGTGELFDELKSKTSTITNIHFHGNVNYEEVPKLIAQSAFGLIPLKTNKMNESISPIKLFDYWSAKKPVIATPVHELKIIGKDCILFAETIKEFVEKIKFLENNPKQALTCGEEGYNRVLGKFNYDAITGEFEKLFYL